MATAAAIAEMACDAPACVSMAILLALPFMAEVKVFATPPLSPSPTAAPAELLTATLNDTSELTKLMLSVPFAAVSCTAVMDRSVALSLCCSFVLMALIAASMEAPVCAVESFCSVMVNGVCATPAVLLAEMLMD